MAEFVSVQSSAGLATIRLDRPPVNALSIALQGELRDAAEQVSADPDIRAVVIYGGEKVFAAGADVTEMAARTYAEMAAISRRLHASFRAVAGIGKPVVAAITGVALGGGLLVGGLEQRAQLVDDLKG
jgi:enoyl-CoA hydratase/carnithine racemase